jgi:hypothetical protein
MCRLLKKISQEMECWNTGVLEYWVLNPSFHYSIVPIFPQLLRCGEAIDGSMGLTMSGMAHIKLFLSRSS